MARIVYADSFSTEQTLFSNIYNYHVSLAEKSLLIPFLKQQKLDITKLFDAVATSAKQDETRLSQKRDSEDSTEKRNLNMKTPWANLRSEVRFLKGFYKGNERELGTWGITVNGKNRIVYPTGFAARAALIQTFLGANAGYPAGESPLQVYLNTHQDIDVNADLQMVSNALKNDKDRVTQDNASQQATQKRDTIWDPVVTAIHLIGDYLMGLYNGVSREMGKWGFVVAEDAAGPREQITTIDPMTTKVVSGVVIPSTLENIGSVELQINKGKGVKTKTSTIGAGEKMGMIKGFSRITISNSSTLAIGKVKVLVSK